MPRFARHLVLALLLGAFATPAHSTAGVPGDESARIAERRAWGARVRELRAAERAELDSLQQAVRLEPAGASQDDARRTLEAAKRAWRRRALEAQLERAEAKGRPEHAARLRVRIADLRRAEARFDGGGAR